MTSNLTEAQQSVRFSDRTASCAYHEDLIESLRKQNFDLYSEISSMRKEKLEIKAQCELQISELKLVIQDLTRKLKTIVTGAANQNNGNGNLNNNINATKMRQFAELFKLYEEDITKLQAQVKSLSKENATILEHLHMDKIQEHVLLQAEQQKQQQQQQDNINTVNNTNNNESNEISDQVVDASAGSSSIMQQNQQQQQSSRLFKVVSSPSLMPHNKRAQQQQQKSHKKQLEQQKPIYNLQVAQLMQQRLTLLETDNQQKQEEINHLSKINRLAAQNRIYLEKSLKKIDNLTKVNENREQEQREDKLIHLQLIDRIKVLEIQNETLMQNEYKNRVKVHELKQDISKQAAIIQHLEREKKKAHILHYSVEKTEEACDKIKLPGTRRVS